MTPYEFRRFDAGKWKGTIFESMGLNVFLVPGCQRYHLSFILGPTATVDFGSSWNLRQSISHPQLHRNHHLNHWNLTTLFWPPKTLRLTPLDYFGTIPTLLNFNNPNIESYVILVEKWNGYLEIFNKFHGKSVGVLLYVFEPIWLNFASNNGGDEN